MSNKYANSQSKGFTPNSQQPRSAAPFPANSSLSRPIAHQQHLLENLETNMDQMGDEFGGMQQMQIQGETNRQTRSAQDQEANKLKLSQDLAKQKDTVARQRYESGCLMVVASSDTTQLTAITEGMPVMDSVRKVPLSVGNVVCDSNGLTGEIIPNPTDPKTPIVGLTAFTNDRTLIANASKRYRGTRYTMPSQQ